MTRALWRAWSPWSLRRQLAREREDVRRFHLHLYCCNVQRDLAEELLTRSDRERAREAWRRQESDVIAQAKTWDV